MVFRDRTRKIVTAVALGSLLTFGQAGVASAHGGGDDHDGHRDKYGYKIRTTTELTVYYRYACAEVESHKRTPYGYVKFRLTGKSYDTETVRLRRGKACVRLYGLRPGWYRLTAYYLGTSRFRPSYDSETFKVRGHGYYRSHHKRYHDDHSRYYDDCKPYYYDHYSKYYDDHKRDYDDRYSRHYDDRYSRYYDDCKWYFDDHKAYYHDHHKDYYKYDDHESYRHRDYDNGDHESYRRHRDYSNSDDSKKDDWSNKDDNHGYRHWDERKRSEDGNKTWDGDGEHTVRSQETSQSTQVSNSTPPADPPPENAATTTVDNAGQGGQDQGRGSNCVVPNASDQANTVAQPTNAEELCTTQ